MKTLLKAIVLTILKCVGAILFIGSAILVGLYFGKFLAHYGIWALVIYLAAILFFALFMDTYNNLKKNKS